ncbi:MAG TPA: alpha-amylase family glycosyl hydrolase [Cyclobacteriaceae bacterium]|nr:alpha-amylase family glycosyl hydrolase [Cyclobacteriaceae bacterium]
MQRILLILIVFLLFSCQPKQEKVARWPYGVNYEVFVRSFADSNGDGIGDFNGLTSRLDYLKELGVGGIWLMPIMPSPTYHKYDVTNYQAVDPEYGTEEDFKKLVAEAHKRDIKILVDLILNHTGSDHPWFQSALKDKNSPYRNYYVWARKDSIREQISKKTTSLDSDNITQWHPVNGDTLSEHYYGFFWGGMPDLNFDNPKVKQEFVDIGKYWLGKMNVDGFRLDAAKHIYPTDRAADNHAVWIWFREEMQKIKPDVYLVGEVWSKAEDVAPYLKGLPALFNFDMGYAITSVVRAGKDTIDLISKYKAISDFYNKSTSEYIDATFLKNHDQNRILSELDNNANKARVAAGILLTLPGTPYIYYGEEIGMLGLKPDEYIREPFLWDEENKDTEQTSWETPKYSTAQTVIPLAKQKADLYSLYNFYKKFINYRNSSSVLTYGSIENTSLQVRELVSFVRKHERDERLIIHNISDVEITLKREQLTGFDEVEFTTGERVEAHENEFIVPAYTTVVLK